MTQVTLDALVAGAISGKIASFPTDTVPALATRPDQSELIFIAKQRSQDKPLILMGDTINTLLSFCQGTPAEMAVWQQVAQTYWPGALTLVLPASERVPRAMHPKDPTSIGLRIPKHPIALQILAETGPLATTSANRSGRPPLLSMAEIAAEFPEVLTLAYTEPQPASGLPSTVAKWTSKEWEILRQGAVKF
ncbi:MAG: L-threonylcarbamoyladenylate synthase [Hormoscilla sp. SP5CHS1]|nr:L-threonylcarbamoyladenylate synthase [Hormoscilla sp. SP12CHS1]MBC6453494.1 L-threonylcarbamoyladenylate synthase [Hormoscilla sp. SP5CHS1]MBC6474159.1 L-threonylcarbamoyladenylate synthase [Hormoscilla sp. GM102CHS1]